MSPNLSKELQLLRPNFLLALALLALARFIPHGSQEELTLGLIGFVLFLFVPCFATLMILGAFGGEMSHGTFSGMLSQPRSRSRIWWTKSLLLLVFMSALWWAWWLTFSHHFGAKFPIGDIGMIRLQTMLLAAALLTGGLWTILLVRSIAAGFWLTVLPPCLLLIVRDWLAGRQFAEANDLLLLLLIIYILGGCTAGYRLFLRAQDVSPFSLTVAAPHTEAEWFHFPARGNGPGAVHPSLALLLKELRLQHGVLRFAAALGTVHLLVAIVAASLSPAHRSSNVDLLLTHFWIIWLMCPLLIGSGVIAEERLLGMWGSQRCLPCSRSRQLLIKALVAGALGVVFGAVCPVALERNNLLIDGRFEPTTILSEQSVLVRQGTFAQGMVMMAKLMQLSPFHPQPLALLSLLSLSLVLLAAFASSLCRSLLQSVSTAMGLACGAVITAVILELSQSLLPPGAFSSGLGMVFLLPTLAAALAWLVARNSAAVEIGPRLWWQSVQLLLAATALSVIAANLVYHRAWELFSPLEPTHGTPTFHLHDQIQIAGGPRAMSFTTADGRSWSADHRDAEWSLAERFFGNPHIQPLSAPIFQLNGTNWAQVVHSIYDTVGIQHDGSLWVCDSPQLRLTAARFDPVREDPRFHMVRVGNERDWKRAAPFQTGVLLLKADGTLWDWQRERLGVVRNPRGLAEYSPRRYSDEVDWDDLRATSFGWAYGFELLRKNGEAWIHPPQNAQLANRLKLDATTEIGRASYLDAGRAKERATVYYALDPSEPFQVAVNPEGKLEIVALWQSSGDARRWTYHPTRIPLGSNRPDRWLSVASAPHASSLVSLRSDGTLWKWTFRHSPSSAPEGASCSQLGRHSDWVALVSHHREVLSLAADGSLWAWQFPLHFRSGWTSLIAPSARPRLLGNILNSSP